MSRNNNREKVEVITDLLIFIESLNRIIGLVLMNTKKISAVSFDMGSILVSKKSYWLKACETL